MTVNELLAGGVKWIGNRCVVEGAIVTRLNRCWIAQAGAKDTYGDYSRGVLLKHPGLKRRLRHRTRGGLSVSRDTVVTGTLVASLIEPFPFMLEQLESVIERGEVTGSGRIERPVDLDGSGDFPPEKAKEWKEIGKNWEPEILEQALDELRRSYEEW